jgi:exoribonuclease II
MFRLARIRWGPTTFNPGESIEYLPESPRDQYVSDNQYTDIYAVAGPVLQCMLEISTQTGVRERMIFHAATIGDWRAEQAMTMRLSRNPPICHGQRKTGYDF